MDTMMKLFNAPTSDTQSKLAEKARADETQQPRREEGAVTRRRQHAKAAMNARQQLCLQAQS